VETIRRISIASFFGPNRASGRTSTGASTKTQGTLIYINEFDLKMIVNDPRKLETIRLRLSDIAWWMRLLCQHIAVRANREDKEMGKFWQSRYRAVRLLDETALLACAAYVDLNPIRAAMAQTLENSDHTSVQRRIQTLQDNKREAVKTVEKTVVRTQAANTVPPSKKATLKTDPGHPDRFLSPVSLEERTTKPGPNPSLDGNRCSDKGFLPMSQEQYLCLLDWTARQYCKDKVGRTPDQFKPILERLGVESTTWCRLVREFGKMFRTVAGQPRVIDTTRSRLHHRRFQLAKATRELLSTD